MKLIVGLGNPGKEYEKTRHNIGFMMLDYYAKLNNIEINKNRNNGLYEELRVNGEKVILLKPKSYMNLSGTVVRPFMDYYKIDKEDILVIHDDLDLPFGRLKVKKDSSAGGHNGIKDIISNIGTQDFLRVKFGISNDKTKDTKDYVLGKFSSQELDEINKKASIVSEIINDFVNGVNLNIIMGKINKKEE